MRSKPTAYVFDIDGVICDSFQEEFVEQFKNGDFSQFERNIANYPSIRWAIDMVNSLSRDHRIIFVTARDENYREGTIKWLCSHLDSTRLYSCDLYMRPANDTRKDAIVKEELFSKFKDSFNILAALDDNWSNCNLWQSLGIPSLTNVIPSEGV